MQLVTINWIGFEIVDLQLTTLYEISNQNEGIKFSVTQITSTLPWKKYSREKVPYIIKV